MVLVKLKRDLAHLQLGLDDVLGVRYEPSEEASNATRNKLRHYSKLMSVFQSINSNQ